MRLFIGILAGIGMTCFQDLLPGHPGQASTLFSNGIRCAGLSHGRWRDHWNGSSFRACLSVLCFVIMFLLTLWRISSL